MVISEPVLVKTLVNPSVCVASTGLNLSKEEVEAGLTVIPVTVAVSFESHALSSS